MIYGRYLAILGSFLISVCASAGPVTFSFESQVQSVSPALVGLFDVGDSLKGNFTFEDSTSPTNSEPGVGVYAAVTSFSLTSGPDIFTASPPTSAIEVWANAGLDQFLVSGTLPSGSGISGFSASSWKLSLIALPPATFSSVALPATPPPFESALIADLQIFYDHPNNGGQRIVASLTALDLAAPVPEPPTYFHMIAGLALVGIGARRFKRR